MVKVVPIDRDNFADKAWRRPPGYTFAADNAVAPLGGGEFANAVLAMPIGFVEQPGGRFAPVALMAITQGKNLFVGPGGHWLGKYVPAILRSYPFYLARPEGKDEAMLCIDEDSGLVVEDGDAENVEKFFEADGKPAPGINVVVELLRRIEQDRMVTELAVAALAEANLIKPWNLTLPVGNQQVTVNGLHRIDEAALNALDDATFLKLRKIGALIIAHGQLLSMGQVGMLSQLTLLQEQILQGPQQQPGQAAPMRPPSDLLPM